MQTQERKRARTEPLRRDRETRSVPLPSGVSNSALLSLYGTSDSAGGQALGEGILARQPNAQPCPQAQIPQAEQEADRLSAPVSAGSPEAVKAEMGRRMEADFSDVRFHTGEDAAARADAMGARAFTSGTDVYFGSGGFDAVIAAHELVHTVQQGGVDSGVATLSTPAGGVQMWPGRKKHKEEEELVISGPGGSAPTPSPAAQAAPEKKKKPSWWHRKARAEYELEEEMRAREDAFLSGAGGTSSPVGRNWEMLAMEADPHLLALEQELGPLYDQVDRHIKDGQGDRGQLKSIQDVALLNRLLVNGSHTAHSGARQIQYLQEIIAQAREQGGRGNRTKAELAQKMIEDIQGKIKKDAEQNMEEAMASQDPWKRQTTTNFVRLYQNRRAIAEAADPSQAPERLPISALFDTEEAQGVIPANIAQGVQASQQAGEKFGIAKRAASRGITGPLPTQDYGKVFDPIGVLAPVAAPGWTRGVPTRSGQAQPLVPRRPAPPPPAGVAPALVPRRPAPPPPAGVAPALVPRRPAPPPPTSAPAAPAAGAQAVGGTNLAPATGLVSVAPDARNPRDLGLPVDRHGKYKGMSLKAFSQKMKENGISFSADPQQRTQNMGKLLELLNYSAAPEIVDDLSQEKRFRQRPEEMMYRGVSSPEGKAEEYLDEFRQGDLFVGGGVYGSGTYFASGHPESTLRTAKDYANREGGNEQRGTETGPNERSAIARFGMKKGARILDVDTYDPKDKDKIAQMRQKQIKAAGEGVDPGLLAAIEDDGFFASMLGYDAIRLTKSAPLATKKRNWVVGLNRGMMIGDRVRL